MPCLFTPAEQENFRWTSKTSVWTPGREARHDERPPGRCGCHPRMCELPRSNLPPIESELAVLAVPMAEVCP